MTHSTNTQSFKYFIDTTIYLPDREVKIEIPVRDEHKKAVDLDQVDKWGFTFADDLISDYLNTNQDVDNVIKEILDYDEFESEYTIRRVEYSLPEKCHFI